MVDVFRRSSAAGGVVDEALRLDPLPRVIWMQLGVVDEDAARRARLRGVTVVMDRCPRIEFRRSARRVAGRGALRRAGPTGAVGNPSRPQQKSKPIETKTKSGAKEIKMPVYPNTSTFSIG